MLGFPNSTAPNQFKAAWEVISHEHSLNRSQKVPLDPDEVN